MACKPGLICGRAAIAVLGLTVLAAPPETGLSAKIDSIFSSLAGKKTPGLAVLARRGGRTMFERGYGVRELRTFATIDSGTDFRLASCTKQFTAMAVMLLVHDGALRYDRTLTELFPEFPEYGRGITIRHLLTHTSGLPDYEELMEQADKAGAGNWSTSNQIHDADVLRLIERQKAGKFAPGTSWAYSNSGYVLLGLIVAKASGEPFERFLHDRIFQLLHMDHTIAFVAGENSVPDRAYGHVKAAEGFRESDQSSTREIGGGKGIVPSHQTPWAVWQ